MNTYLNIPQDDMRITHIIEDILSKINNKMSLSDFKDSLIELDNIDCGGLCEDDEDLICDFIDDISSLGMDKHMDYFMGDQTMMPRGQAFGSYMKFLKYL